MLMNTFDCYPNSFDSKISKTQFLRFFHMGLADINGNPDPMGLKALAKLTSRCLYDDLEKSYAVQLYLSAIDTLFSLQPSLKCYALLLRAYSEAGEAVPKPIRLLATVEDFLSCFLLVFFENWREQLVADGLLEV